jgi:hypothetical protein
MLIDLKSKLAVIREALKHFLFGATYLSNLKLLHVFTTLYTNRIVINLSKELALIPVSRVRRRSSGLVLALLGVWSGIFCVRVGFLESGIAAGSKITDTVSQKIIDIGWINLLVSCFLFKLEIHRKANEVSVLINSTTVIEKKSIQRGNRNPNTLEGHFRKLS